MNITGVFTRWTKRIAERCHSMSMMPPVVRLAAVLLLQVVVVDRHVVVLTRFEMLAAGTAALKRGVCVMSQLVSWPP